jgi:hypothetical protein
MDRRTTALLLSLGLGGFLACSGGGTGSTTGADPTGGSSTLGGSSGGGSSGGTSTTSAATSCDIADAGTFNKGATNPSNVCEVCDPSQQAGTWSSSQACGLCHDTAGTAGICTGKGICCTTVCDSTGTCKVDGGIGLSCGSNSDCCGIAPGICT